MENLPNELRTEILLRLPIKSLACLKCVSKSWRSLISDPNFPKLHFQRSPQHYTHRFPYFVHSDHDHTHLRMRAIDIHASPRDDSAAISFDFPSDYNVMLASCRGFLLLLNKRIDKLLVWNPSTGERKQIRVPETHMNFELHGFCYDESTDDYLIVLVSVIGPPAFWIFSVGNNSWNQEVVINHRETIVPLSPVVSGSVVNGVIYWLVYFGDERGYDEVNILALDIKTNQVRRVVPNIDDIKLILCHLRLLGESLALIDLTYYDEIKVWVMEEGERESSWTKRMSIPRNPEARGYISPLCFNKDGQLVTLRSCSPLTLSRWSSEQGKLEEDRTCNGFQERSFYASTPVYTETLLSLPPHRTPNFIYH
ncbi:hypothetical protein K1719_000237 [Acacia pycnantha]|nr:hypothetical protein K1719_000237 [Acacia pycnantha]